MALAHDGRYDRDTLVRALLLSERFSVGLTRVAVETLGEHRSGNRDVELLLAIHGAPDASPGWLSTATSRDPASVSRSLRHLVDERLVTRRPSPVDGRSSLVRLSRRGRTRIANFELALSAFIAEAAPLVKEIVDLLKVPDDVTVGARGVLEATNILARVGAAYVNDVTDALRPFAVSDRLERFTLTLLLDRGDLRPRDLVHEFGLLGSQVTEVLDRLSGMGILVRGHDDPADRRAVVVRLTDRGKTAADVQLDVFARHADRICSALALTARLPGGAS